LVVKVANGSSTVGRAGAWAVAPLRSAAKLTDGVLRLKHVPTMIRASNRPTTRLIERRTDGIERRTDGWEMVVIVGVLHR
jgi:hypothetical protein